MARLAVARARATHAPETSIPLEVELKLALDAAAVPALLRHPALRPLRRGRTRTAHVVSTYFDSPDFRLERADVALRVRRIGRRWIQTLKGPPQAGAGAGLHARPEHEWPLPGPQVDLAATGSHAVEEAGRQGRRRTADSFPASPPTSSGGRSRSSSRMDRPRNSASTWARSARRATAARDANPIAEIEIELKSGDAANLFRLALALSADLPLAVLTDTKAARGYALRRGLPRAVPSPVRAQDVPLAPDVTTADALAAVARGCLHQIAANAPGLVADDDPEWIHQMRVGTRRLRSCLGLLAPVRPAAALDPVVAEVKWLAALLGTARNWDVFVTRNAAAARRVVRPRRGRGAGHQAASRARGRASAHRAERRPRGGRLAPLPAPAAGRGPPVLDCGSHAARFGATAAPPAPDERAATFAAAAARAPPSQVRAHRRPSAARVQRGAARGADRRQAAALRRRVLRPAVSRASAPEPTSRRSRACRTRSADSTTR